MCRRGTTRHLEKGPSASLLSVAAPLLFLSLPFSHTHGRRDRFVSQAVGSASLARARNCEEPRSRERAGCPYFRAMQPAQARSRGQIKKTGVDRAVLPRRRLHCDCLACLACHPVLPVTLSSLRTFGSGWCTAQLLLGVGGFRWMLTSTLSHLARRYSVHTSVPNVYEVC